MIFTHPLLFNIIVVLFIAFTSGWMVFVVIDRRAKYYKQKLNKLESEKENLRRHALNLEEQLQKPYSISNTPIISLSSSIKINKTREESV